MAEIKVDLKKDYIDSLDKILDNFSNEQDVNEISLSDEYSSSLTSLFHLTRSLFSQYQECLKEYELNKIFESTEYLVNNAHLIYVTDTKTLQETYTYLRGINEFYSKDIDEKYKTFLEEFESLEIEELIKATISIYLLTKVSARKDLILQSLKVDNDMLKLFISYLEFLTEVKTDITTVKDGVPIFNSPEYTVKYLDYNLNFRTNVFQRLMVKGVKL